MSLDENEKYAQKYRRYKKLYVDERNRRRQTGGNNGMQNKDIPLINFTVTRTNEEYTNIIDKLRKNCTSKISTFNQLEDKLSYLYDVIGEEDLSMSGIQNIIKNKKYNLKENRDLNEYYRKICQVVIEKIIPKYEEISNLQQRLIDSFSSSLSLKKTELLDKIAQYTKGTKGGNDNLEPDFMDRGENQGGNKGVINIDLSKYIEYAKKNNLLNDSVSTILQRYDGAVKKYSDYFNEEKILTQDIIRSLPPGTSSIQTIPKNARLNTNTRAIGQVTKSGKTCLTKCEKKNDMWRGEYMACNVEPYSSFFLKYDWDFCDNK